MSDEQAERTIRDAARAYASHLRSHAIEHHSPTGLSAAGRIDAALARVAGCPDEDPREVGERYAEALTPHEARCLRIALAFGVPDPTPPEIASAVEKLRAIEAAARPAATGEANPLALTDEDRAEMQASEARFDASRKAATRKYEGEDPREVTDEQVAAVRSEIVKLLGMLKERRTTGCGEGDPVRVACDVTEAAEAAARAALGAVASPTGNEDPTDRQRRTLEIAEGPGRWWGADDAVWACLDRGWLERTEDSGFENGLRLTELGREALADADEPPSG